MNKIFSIGIVLTLLALSITAGLVAAKRPVKDLPIFRVSIGTELGDEFKIISPDYLDKEGSDEYWGPDDLYDRRGNIVYRANWDIYYWGFGEFQMPISSEYYDGETVQVMGVVHQIWDYGAQDDWVLDIIWSHDRDGDGIYQQYYMVVKSSTDSNPEGIYSEIDDEWTISLDDTNTEFVVINELECELVTVEIGKSGKTSTEEVCGPATLVYDTRAGDAYFDFTFKVQRLT